MSTIKNFLKKHYDAVGMFVGYKTLGKLRYAFNRLNKDKCFLTRDDINTKPKYYAKVYSRTQWEKINNELNLNPEIINNNGIEKIKSKNYHGLVLPGKCDLCGSEYGFLAPVDLNDMKSKRETFGCFSCLKVNRERIILNEVKKLYFSGKTKIYMYETGNDFNFVKKFAPESIGSEYISPEYKSGEVVNGILHEDAHSLSFADESFDVVVSRDVFEHVSDIKQCLREAHRVLRREGYCLISVPWDPKADSNFQRAKLNDSGDITYFLEPAYHWNPVTNKSDSLVFWNYGWEFLDFLKQAGFNDAYVSAYYDPELGYFGELGSFFVALKD